MLQLKHHIFSEQNLFRTSLNNTESALSSSNVTDKCKDTITKNFILKWVKHKIKAVDGANNNFTQFLHLIR